MAAEGAWPQSEDLKPPGGAERTRASLLQLRTLLDELEVRLGADRERPLSPQAVTSLALALQALARQIDPVAAPGPPPLSEALTFEVRLAESEARILGRLDRLQSDVEARAGAERPGEPKLVTGVLIAASAAALISIAAAGGWLIAQPRTDDPIAEVLADLPFRKFLRPDRPAPEAVRAALRPLPPIRSAPPRSAAGESPADAYAAVVRALDRGDAQALARLTALADSGNAQAQLHLAGLYEQGASGLSRDVVAARLWTRKAAEGGDRIAMHNLALYLAQGDGGPRDVSEASQWFRRAAERGVVDSQYNLALLYEAGRGVEKNLREAYRWFSIAANAGDAVSRGKAVELEAKLKGAERGDVERAARSFAPGAAPTTEAGPVIPPATTVAETQVMLARAGYYVGPVDGASSPILVAAAAAYTHDHPAKAP